MPSRKDCYRLRIKREGKERRKNLRRKPTQDLSLTVEQLTKIFSTHGCVHKDCRRLSLYYETIDIPKAFEFMVGGTVRKQGCGYLWIARGEHALSSARILLPHAIENYEHLIKGK